MFRNSQEAPGQLLEIRNCVRRKYAAWLLSPSTFVLSNWQQKHVSIERSTKDRRAPPSHELPEGKQWVKATHCSSHTPTPVAFTVVAGYQNSLQQQGNRDSQIQDEHMIETHYVIQERPHHEK